MLLILALAAVLNVDSVNVNAVEAMANLDSLLTAQQVVVTDTPTVVIQTCTVAPDSLRNAFSFAHLYLRERVVEAKQLPGYEHSIVVSEHPEPGKSKVYVLLCHDDGNLPEIIFRNTGKLGVLELTYITHEGTVIAVEKN